MKDRLIVAREGMRVGGWWVWLPEVRGRDPYGDGNIVYLDCINISILVVILYWSFVRCYN